MSVLGYDNRFLFYIIKSNYNIFQFKIKDEALKRKFRFYMLKKIKYNN